MEGTMLSEVDSAYLKHKKIEIIGHFVRSFDEITGIHSYHYVSRNGTKFSGSTTNANATSVAVGPSEENLNKCDCHLMNYSETISEDNMAVVHTEIRASSNQNELSKNQQKLMTVKHACLKNNKQHISKTFYELLTREQETKSASCGPTNGDETVTAHNLQSVPESHCEMSIRNLPPANLNLNSYSKDFNANSTYSNISMNANAQIAYLLKDAPRSREENISNESKSAMNGDPRIAYFSNGPQESEHDIVLSHNISPVNKETRTLFNLNELQKRKPGYISSKQDNTVNVVSNVSNQPTCVSSNTCEIPFANNQSSVDTKMKVSSSVNSPSRSISQRNLEDSRLVDGDGQILRNVNIFSRCNPETRNITPPANMETQIQPSPSCITRGQPSEYSPLDVEMMNPFDFNPQARNQLGSTSRYDSGETDTHNSQTDLSPDHQHETFSRHPVETEEQNSTKATISSECGHETNSTHLRMQPEEQYLLSLEINTRRSKYDPEETDTHNSQTDLSPDHQHETFSRHPFETEEQNSTKANTSSGCGHEMNSTHLLKQSEEQCLLNFDMNTKCLHETNSTHLLKQPEEQYWLNLDMNTKPAHETTLLDNGKVRVEFQFNFTSETELYDRVMTYLRDTHDICCSYASTFVNVLQDMLTVMSGCEDEFLRFKPLLPNADNIQEALYSYLEIVKALCKSVYEHVTHTDKLMNTCLDQQRTLNKVCAGMAYSPVPFSINDDALDIIHKLYYDLYNVNNYIQRNIESVRTYHIYKDEIVYIMNRIRQIYHQLQF